MNKIVIILAILILFYKIAYSENNSEYIKLENEVNNLYKEYITKLRNNDEETKKLFIKFKEKEDLLKKMEGESKANIIDSILKKEELEKKLIININNKSTLEKLIKDVNNSGFFSRFLGLFLENKYTLKKKIIEQYSLKNFDKLKTEINNYKKSYKNDSAMILEFTKLEHNLFLENYFNLFEKIKNGNNKDKTMKLISLLKEFSEKSKDYENVNELKELNMMFIDYVSISLLESMKIDEKVNNKNQNIANKISIAFNNEKLFFEYLTNLKLKEIILNKNLSSDKMNVNNLLSFINKNYASSDNSPNLLKLKEYLKENLKQNKIETNNNQNNSNTNTNKVEIKKEDKKEEKKDDKNITTFNGSDKFGNIVAAIGDSITANNGYISELRKLCPKYSFDNYGIVGNSTTQVLSRISEKDSDKINKRLGLEDYDQIIVLCGVNNIYNADRVISDLKTIYAKIKSIKSHNIRVIAMTLTPWGGYSTWDLQKQKSTEKVNQFILSKPENVDEVINLYDVLKDPNDPTKMKKEYCSPKDVLHPNSLGQKIIGQTIFEKAFKK